MEKKNKLLATHMRCFPNVSRLLSLQQNEQQHKALPLGGDDDVYNYEWNETEHFIIRVVICVFQ
jgi:hypothetical protein